MKTIQLSRDEELALREVIATSHKHYSQEGNIQLESILNKIRNAPDDTIMAMHIIEPSSPKCDDCDLITTDLIAKGDHHGGIKIVCRDRDACHRRSP